MASPEPGETCALVGVLERSREGSLPPPAALCLVLGIQALHYSLPSYSVPAPVLLLSGFWN